MDKGNASSRPAQKYVICLFDRITKNGTCGGSKHRSKRSLRYIKIHHQPQSHIMFIENSGNKRKIIVLVSPFAILASHIPSRLVKRHLQETTNIDKED